MPTVTLGTSSKASSLSAWRADLCDVARGLRARPGPAAVVVLTLAFGAGINTAIFGVVNGVVLRALPFSSPERLVHIWSRGPNHPQEPMSLPDLLDFAERARSFDGLAGWASFAANVTGKGDPERLQGLTTTPRTLAILGVRPVLGRLPTPEEENAGGNRVVLLTYGLWQRRFGGAASAIGESLTLNGVPHSVVGVLPSDFALPPRDADLVTALWVDQDARRTNRAAGFLRGLGRLKPGTTLAQASSDLERIAVSLAGHYPDTNAKKPGVRVTSLHGEIVGRVRTTVWMLQAAALLVLVIAGANLSSLLLARTIARRAELAIRSALGASRTRLARLLFGETLVLSVAGGFLALSVGHFGLQLLLAIGPADLPRRSQLHIDAVAGWFALLLAISAGLLAGMAPALVFLRRQDPEVLKGTRGASDTHGRSARGWLLAVEVGLAVVVLAGAGLLLQSLRRLQRVELGFDSAKLLTVRLSFPRARYGTPAELAAFHDRLAARLRELPGVEAVGATSVTPFMEWRASVDFGVEGRPPATREQIPNAHYRMIDPGYLPAMRIPIARGRHFEERDGPGSAAVAIVNETLARRFLGDQDPIGAFLLINDAGGSTRKVEVVGVAGNIKHYGLDDAPSFDIYVPMAQIPKNVAIYLANNMSWVLRTSSEPMALAEPFREELRRADPEVPASFVRSMDAALRGTLLPRRFNLVLLQVFGVAALALSALGIYAVTAQAVQRRTREMGVRMALGAAPGQILRLVFADAAKPIALGLLSGLAAAVVLLRLVTSLLYEVSPTDPPTLFAAIAILAVVAAVAVYAPARRATRVDPVVALRAE
jgi:putative ABC transport system permease protein